MVLSYATIHGKKMYFYPLVYKISLERHTETDTMVTSSHGESEILF